MTEAAKKKLLKKEVTELLKESHKESLERIDKVLASGAIDLDSWDGKKFVLPKTIVCALLERQSVQFLGIGSGLEKQIKEDVRNIRYFI